MFTSTASVRSGTVARDSAARRAIVRSARVGSTISTVPLIPAGSLTSLAPCLYELLSVQLAQICPELPDELRRVARRQLPEQHNLPVVDRNDLDPVVAAGIGQER